MTKVSIITATLNSEATIKHNIISVNRQKYKNIEHIIIDGLSNDRTLEVIRKYKNLKNRIIYSSRDRGIYYALNKGVSLSNGAIICFLNSDDYFLDKNVINKVVNCFKLFDADVVYGNLNYVKKKKLKIFRKWKSSTFQKNFLKKGWMPPHPSTFIKKKIVKRKKWFNTNYKISADYDFLVKLFRDDDVKKKYLDQIIINMRVGGISNNSFKNLIKKSFEDYKIIRKNNLCGIFTLFMKNLRKIPQLF